jgi:hypothetical protein
VTIKANIATATNTTHRDDARTAVPPRLKQNLMALIPSTANWGEQVGLGMTG